MKKVIVQCGIQINNEYWFAAGNTNGLFKKNLSSGQLSFVGFFLNETNTQFRAYTDVKLVDNKLVFTPCFAKRIAIYDLEKKEFSDMALPNYEGAMNQYINSVRYKDFVYFIPFSSSFFLKYHVGGRLENIDEWTALKKKYLVQGGSNLIIESICTDGNNIYMFMSNGNKVIILDMDTDKFRVENLDIPSDECICSVCKVDSRIWIATNRKRIYQWDYLNNMILHTFDLHQYIIDTDYIAHYIYVVGKYVYIINVYDKDIRVFDYINNEFTTIDMSKYIKDKTDDNVSLYYYYDIKSVDDKKMSLFSYYDGKYVTIEGMQVTDSISGFYLTEDYLEKIITDKFSSNPFFYEGHTLREFASMLSEEIKIILIQGILVKNCENQLKKSFGELIYDILTKEES